jgi:hypothetical protein
MKRALILFAALLWVPSGVAYAESSKVYICEGIGRQTAEEKTPEQVYNLKLQYSQEMSVIGEADVYFGTVTLSVGKGEFKGRDYEYTLLVTAIDDRFLHGIYLRKNGAVNYPAIMKIDLSKHPTTFFAAETVGSLIINGTCR